MHKTPFTMPKAKLDLRTLVTCAFLVGFFSGLVITLIIVGIPLLEGTWGDVTIANIAVIFWLPFSSGASAAISTIFAYPIYKWAPNRYFSHSVSGVKVE